MLRTDKLLGLALIVICLYFNDNYWRSVWADKWFLVMLSLNAFWAYKIAGRFHWSVGALLFALMSSALWGFGWNASYSWVDLTTQLAIKEVTAYTYGALVMLSLMAYFADKQFFETMGKFISCVCLTNAAAIVVQTLLHYSPQARGGLLGNPSMSGCLLAFTFPVMLFRNWEDGETSALTAVLELLGAGLVTVAIFLTGASQPPAVLAVTIGALALAKYRPTPGRTLGVILFLTGGTTTLLRLSTYRPHEGVFDSSGRFGVWHLGLSWWLHHGHRFVGEGTGISQVALPLIQRAALPQVYYGQKLDWWMWFHSDWIQLLFENGLIGFAAGVVMYGYALHKSWLKAPWLFSAVAGVGATALFNFPAHFPVHAFIAVIIFAMAFDPKYLAPDPYR